MNIKANKIAMQRTDLPLKTLQRKISEALMSKYFDKQRLEPTFPDIHFLPATVTFLWFLNPFNR
jgi:hypothetical protein